MSRASSPRAFWRHVFATELLSLVRDRRALFAGLVLPALLYPLLFLGQGWLEEIGRETLEAKEVRVAHELSAAPAPLAERLVALLEQEVPIALDELPPDSYGSIEEEIQLATPEAWLRETEAVRALLGADGDVLLMALPDPDAPRGTLVRLHYDGADEGSREARNRVRSALGTLREELEGERFEELFGGDPAAAWLSESRDLASEEDLGGALIGRLLPLIAVLVLLSGGSYAALAAFAGEREAGTLETLLVQPVPSLHLVWGKFAAVLTTGVLTLVLNTASLAVCAAAGLGSFSSFGGGADLGGGGPGLLRVLGASVFLVPVCLFLCAVLCLVCGKARSFREGQHYVLPLSLIAMLPTAIAMRPEVELDAFLACVPLAGPALAFRQAMVGSLAVVPGALAFGSTLVYAALALRQLGGLLDGEKVLASESTSAESALRRVQSRTALSWGWAGVFAVYLVGGLVQSWRPLPGLLFTLWVLLPVLAIFAARGTARRAGESLPRTLGLRIPSAHHTVGAVLAAPALAWCASRWIEWQQEVLPLPSSMTRIEGLPDDFASLSTVGLFLAFALSPGLSEELFFRGAVLSGLRRDLPAWKSIAWQALLFGAVHASIYRFLPTAVLGALLAAITLRSRSLVPAVLLHVAYNGTLVLGENAPLAVEGSRLAPWLLVPAAVLLGLPARRREHER